jgi:3-oxoacyl-[acyl-carrier-protein] synthase-3
MSVYVTATGAFLPGPPIDNEAMEARGGLIGGEPSRYKKMVLRNNGIETRHYALDDEGRQTHLNEELAATAIERAAAARGLSLGEIGMLAVGTTLPDIMAPGFASMVHGRLGRNSDDVGPMEVLTTGGICASGAAALQHAWAALATERHDRAIACGSELGSPMGKPSRWAHEITAHAERTDAPEGFHYFNAEFLRFMLSDGAGAALLERTPNPEGRSLRVDWIELSSYAHELPVCMYLGTSDPNDVRVGNTWLTVDDPAVAHEEGMLLLRQNTRVLADNIVRVGMEESKRLIKKGRIDPKAGYDWCLPHLSSYFFQSKLQETMHEVGVEIPPERWFTNLKDRGNTGAASIYIILNEALEKGLFSPGDRILAIVPESGRFIMSFMQFTCV